MSFGKGGVMKNCFFYLLIYLKNDANKKKGRKNRRELLHRLAIVRRIIYFEKCSVVHTSLVLIQGRTKVNVVSELDDNETSLGARKENV